MTARDETNEAQAALARSGLIPGEWTYELGYDERAVKGLLDALGIPDADGLVLSDRVGILAARYMRALVNS